MTPETFCQHFATFAEAPNGVAKLRELILQLAVQGKLLPQDANDEPAATLLKRVRQARNKTNGRPEKLRGIYQQQAKLPGGWEWFQLNELGEFCGGGTPSMRQSEYWNGKIPWVSPKDMKVSHITSSELRFTDAALKGTRIRLIPRKSILVVARSGILKRTLPVAINEVECTVNQDLKVLIPFLPELSEYIRLMLRGHESMILATLIKGGVTVQSLKYEEFEIQPFPFPPIAEQRRIVEKVDQLLGQCDELAARQAARREARSALVGATLDRLVSARSSAEFPAHAHRLRDNFDRLFDTPTTIPQLRQAILQLAVQGQLVPQDPNDEPASVLITRIVAQKAQLIRDKNIRNSNSHTSRDAGAETDVLPNGWSWVTLDAITEIGTGGPPPTGTKEYYKDGTIPWVTSSATNSEFIVQPQQFITQDAVDACGLKIYPAGSLVVALYGQGKTRGQVGQLMFDSTSNQACAGIRFFGDGLKVRDYVRLVFRKKYHELRALAAGGAQPNLNGGMIRLMRVPLPPLAEQKRIVSKVTELLSLCDALEAKVMQAESSSTQILSAAVHHLLESTMKFTNEALT